MELAGSICNTVDGETELAPPQSVASNGSAARCCSGTIHSTSRRSHPPSHRNAHPQNYAATTNTAAAAAVPALLGPAKIGAKVRLCGGAVIIIVVAVVVVAGVGRDKTSANWAAQLPTWPPRICLHARPASQHG